ncbi:DUF7500 family protein [Haloarchaeobius iranensis]|uniref:Uncharacterized protein n=1 Tax=Haloarchaeobius iranensis TaxID=996166 RepID=A0A1G9ZIP2_9EURY|nr:hypothetical protein [Haloarchaeobius iranensis]SDN20373.1 hypothetical protein SAMN05192554_12037 [Haloarchaeobius iranensis]
MNERTKHTDERADGILSPEELTPSEDHCEDLGDGRFVVSASDGPSAEQHGGTRLPDVDPALAGLAADGSGDPSGAPASADALANANERYGVDIAVKTDDGVAQTEIRSDDVREVFTSLLTWYADELDDEMEAEETLRILLDASPLEV